MSFIETLAMKMHHRKRVRCMHASRPTSATCPTTPRCSAIVPMSWQLGGPAGQHPSPCGPQTLRARHPGCRSGPGQQLLRAGPWQGAGHPGRSRRCAGHPEGREPSGLTDEERAILPFARKVARDATKVTQDDIDRLRHAGLDDAEIFDIIVVTAARAFFTTLLDGLGVQADGAFADMEEGLRQALTVGRPIAGVESAGVESAGAEDGHHAPVSS